MSIRSIFYACESSGHTSPLPPSSVQPPASLPSSARRPVSTHPCSCRKAGCLTTGARCGCVAAGTICIPGCKCGILCKGHSLQRPQSTTAKVRSATMAENYNLRFVPEGEETTRTSFYWPRSWFFPSLSRQIFQMASQYYKLS